MNKEETKQYMQEYYKKNIKKMKLQSAKFKEKNPDKIRGYGKKYKKKYPERIKKQQKKWQKKNRERLNKYMKVYQSKPEVKIKNYVRFTTRYKYGKATKCMICGSKKNVEYHHPEPYNRDIFIEVCKKCHVEIHRQEEDFE